MNSNPLSLHALVQVFHARIRGSPRSSRGMLYPAAAALHRGWRGESASFDAAPGTFGLWMVRPHRAPARDVVRAAMQTTLRDLEGADG